ncbi:hypothetical protein MKW98_015454 [Papaver atlanticum]|uniref:Uncharacterized protein n=1 Tax=Papaver atlanticum TaxID=357466 RepID=A0AAD4RZL7_9MAGN|nr:hypothetical protein MKW98_015454 [Papaver atlanticum]
MIVWLEDTTTIKLKCQSTLKSVKLLRNLARSHSRTSHQRIGYGCKRSATGSNNRKLVKYNHCGGSRAFQVCLEKKKVLGVEAAKIQTFHNTHTRIKEGKHVWISETAHVQYVS